MSGELDLEQLKNIARLKAEQAGKKITSMAESMENNWDDVKKAAQGGKMESFLNQVEAKSLEKNIPKQSILKQIMEAARNRANPLSEVKAIPSGFGKVKAIPGLGALAAVGAALSSGEAGAATMDALVPGGVEGVGPAEGSLDEAIESPQKTELQKEMLRKMLNNRQG